LVFYKNKRVFMTQKIKIAQYMCVIAGLLILGLTPPAHGMNPQEKFVKIEPRSPQEYIDVSFVEAAQNGYYRRVEELLPLVDVNVRVGSDNSCALGQAIMNQHESILSLLFKQRRLDLNSPINARGVLPLAGATLTQNLDIVKMLVFARADIEEVDNDGVHPLLLASELGAVDIVKFFLPRVSEKVVALKAKPHGASALYMASQHGHDQVVELLVENLDKQDIDVCCEAEGTTSLWIASQKGHDKTVQTLIKAKANVNARRKEFGSTPLWVACVDGHLKTVNFLIDAKADVGIADSRDVLPIHLAAEKGHLDILELLLGKKSDSIHAQNQNGSTPLHAASNTNKLNAVALLLANKADPETQDFFGKTALDYASDLAVRELLERELLLRKLLTGNQGAQHRGMSEHVIDIENIAGSESEKDGGAQEKKEDGREDSI
jgi:ankyrin repeat protein